jgi:hypothetical protein
MSSLYLTQPFLLKTSVCILILVKCQKMSESVTNMFLQGADQDPSLLVNCKYDGYCPGFVGIYCSSHRQHPPSPQPDQSERSTSSPHSGRTLSLTFQSPPVWCKAVGSGNILVTSPGEIYSIYSPGRLGINKQIIKSRIVVHLSINFSGKLKTSPEMSVRSTRCKFGRDIDGKRFQTFSGLSMIV